MSDFAGAISNWDGKSIAPMIEVHAQFGSVPGYSDQLVAALRDANTLLAASWLIKHHLENGGGVDLVGLSAVLAVPSVRDAVLKDWQCHLHMLQVMPMLRSEFASLSDSDLKIWALLVSTGQESDVKFVRAWAWQGAFELLLARLGVDKDSLVGQSDRDAAVAAFSRKLDDALAVEKGAVAARLRKVSAQVAKL